MDVPSVAEDRASKRSAVDTYAITANGSSAMHGRGENKNTGPTAQERLYGAGTGPTTHERCAGVITDTSSQGRGATLSIGLTLPIPAKPIHGIHVLGRVTDNTTQKTKCLLLYHCTTSKFLLFTIAHQFLLWYTFIFI